MTKSEENKVLEEVFEEVFEDCKKIGFRCGDIRKIETSKRFAKKWGRCSKNSLDGTYTLTFAYTLLEHPEGLKKVVMHEVLHTGFGCMSHTGEWKRWANKVNATFPHKYDVKRCSSVEEIGCSLPVENVTKYVLECEGCGQTVKRTKLTKFVKHPEYYKCGICGGKFKRIR